VELQSSLAGVGEIQFLVINVATDHKNHMERAHKISFRGFARANVYAKGTPWKTRRYYYKGGNDDQKRPSNETTYRQVNAQRESGKEGADLVAQRSPLIDHQAGKKRSTSITAGPILLAAGYQKGKRQGFRPHLLNNKGGGEDAVAGIAP